MPSQLLKPGYGTVLIKARSHNLSCLIACQWGPEIWKEQFQFTEWSFAACNTYNCHRQHYLQSNSKNVRGTSGRDNFKLHDLQPAFCNLEYSRISVPSSRGALVGLSPPKQIPSHSKLKFETLSINGVLLNFRMLPPLHKRKAPLLEIFWWRFCV